MKKICKGCKIEKEIEEFNYKNKRKLIKQSHCKKCTRLQVRNHYYKRHEYYLAKARKRNALVRHRVKEYIWEYLKLHPCADCGEKDIIVLTFDHKGDKSFNVSDTTRWRYGLVSLKNEIAKCEVRCANCHLRKSAKQFGWEKSGLVA